MKKGNIMAVVSVANSKGVAFTRTVFCLAKTKGDLLAAVPLAERLFPDQPAIAACLKSSVSSGGAVAGNWANALVVYNIIQDFFAAAQAREVISRVPGIVHVPKLARIPAQTSNPSGSWVSPGAPLPVSEDAFQGFSLYPFVAGILTVVDDELLKSATPESIGLLQELLISRVVRFCDAQFLDPSVVGVVDTNPASVTNGGIQVSSTGDPKVDLPAMVGAADELQNPCWIMNAKKVSAISAALGTPGINISGGFLFGIPIVCSKSSPFSSSSPYSDIIVLLDGAALALYDVGNGDVSVSKAAALQMDSAPTGNSLTSTATTLTSLFQNSSTAIRVQREISWQLTRTGGCIWTEAGF